MSKKSIRGFCIILAMSAFFLGTTSSKAYYPTEYEISVSSANANRTAPEYSLEDSNKTNGSLNNNSTLREPDLAALQFSLQTNVQAVASYNGLLISESTVTGTKEQNLLYISPPTSIFAPSLTTIDGDTFLHLTNIATDEALCIITIYEVGEIPPVGVFIPSSIPVHGAITVSIAELISTPLEGGAVIECTQPIAAIITQTSGGDQTLQAYEGVGGGAPINHIPLILKNSGDRDTEIWVQNTDSDENEIIINFTPSSSSCGNPHVLTDILPPGTVKVYRQSDMPALGTTFCGTATVASSNNSPLATVVKVWNSSRTQVAAYIGVELADLLSSFAVDASVGIPYFSFAPFQQKRAYDEWSTELWIANFGINDATYATSFYDIEGFSKDIVIDIVNAGIVKKISLDSLPNLPVGYGGMSDLAASEPLAALTTWTKSNSSETDTFGIYSFTNAPGQKAILPHVVGSVVNGTSTDFTIGNTSNYPATITINYFNSNGNLTAVIYDTLQPYGSERYSTINNLDLGDEWEGSVVIESDQPIVVEVNEIQYRQRAPVIYVDMSATGTNNGTSWADAYTKLRDALSISQSGDEIWVAAGTYRPGLPFEPAESTFQLKNGVEIYGGFVGTETTRDDRQWEINKTILSGDLNHDDGSENLVENSYHVVTATRTDATAILDGFFITGGNASGSGLYDRGGGIYNFGGSPTLRNLVIHNNHAIHGAGMYNQQGANPMLIDVTFLENHASSNGGGVENDESTPVLIDVDFIRNEAGDYGGGINNNKSNHILINTGFYGNAAGHFGGGLNNDYSNPHLTNVLFVGNVASIGGGGLASQNSCPVLINSTLGWNSAPNGGGIHQSPSCAPTIKNSILWGNGNNQISGSVDISYSLVQNDYPGNNIIVSDPLFFATPSSGKDGVWGTSDDDYGDLHLQIGSPAINFGSNGALPKDDYDLDNDSDTNEAIPYDLDGNIRILNSKVDLGVYEVELINQPPIPNAGPDQMVNTLDLVTLNGSASTDPENNLPLEYEWTQTRGPTVTLSNSTTANPTFTAPVDPADLIFSLTVNDSLGLSSPTPDEVIIYVISQPISKIYMPIVFTQ